MLPWPHNAYSTQPVTWIGQDGKRYNETTWELAQLRAKVESLEKKVDELLRTAPSAPVRHSDS